MSLSTTGYITAPIDELLKYGNPTHSSFVIEVEIRIDRLRDQLKQARSQRDELANLVSGTHAGVDLWLDLYETGEYDEQLAQMAVNKLREVRKTLSEVKDSASYDDEEV